MGGTIRALNRVLEVPKYNAAFTSINLLLGVGPIIVPGPFYNAGILLSTLWMAAIIAISYNSAMYVAESISKLEQIEHLRLRPISNAQHSILSMEENTKRQSIGEIAGTQAQGKLKTYDHMEQFRLLYGEKWRLLPSLTISIYLMFSSISKCIMTGETLSGVFKDVAVLQKFQFWLGIFFLSGAVFSFKSIDKTKILQITIIGVRFLSIILMLVGAVILMVQRGVRPLIPETGAFNLDFFGDIFSNLVFSFLFHHSLPGITKQLQNTQQVRYFIKLAYLVAGITMIIIPVSGIMAFGNELGTDHKLRYYNEDFKGHFDFIYYIVSFYVFLNVAAFSVYIIVIRANILAIIAPKIDPNVPSKTTLSFSLVLLSIILLAGFYLKDQIHVALSFTGGIFGCIILFVIPSLEVYQARRILAQRAHQFRNYKAWLPLVIMTLGFVCMGFNLYQTIGDLFA